MNGESLPGNNDTLQGYSKGVSATLKQARGVSMEITACIKNHGEYIRLNQWRKGKEAVESLGLISHRSDW